MGCATGQAEEPFVFENPEGKRRWFFEGLAVDLNQNSLLLEKLAIDDYKGRLHIAADGSINASNVWKEEVGEQVEEIAENLMNSEFATSSVQTTAHSHCGANVGDNGFQTRIRKL